MAVYMFIFIMCIIFLKTAWHRKQSKTNKRTKAEVFLLLVTEEEVRKCLPASLEETTTML